MSWKRTKRCMVDHLIRTLTASNRGGLTTGNSKIKVAFLRECKSCVLY